MHRQISHTDKPFYQETNLSLYLLTGLIGLLIGLDLWPIIVRATGLDLPTWSNEFQAGYRLALLAAILGGARVLYTSLEGLLEGKVGADLALAIACVAAILFNRPLVAAEIVFIGMFGECLESFTFERTQRAIRRVVEVCPRRCWLLRDGQEVRVLTSELKVGDIVVVKPGARIPVDGVVREGRSAIDSSALTGESLPVDRGPGEEVYAGTLNQFGALTIEARRAAEHTVVGQVIELTAKALQEKAGLERTADRLARYFLPAVLGLAGLTFIVGVVLNLHDPVGGRRSLLDAIGLSLDPTLAVLVVACPCALILATPAAVIAALGRLAGTGILIKGGAALERLAQVDALAFDKTGTLTEGRLELGDVVPLAEITANELLRIAASAEQPSEHPIGTLLVKQARERGLALEPIEEFRAYPGAGIVATFSRAAAGGALPVRVAVGTPRLLEEQGLSLSPEASALLHRLDEAGQSALLVARDGVVLGVIGGRDQVRPEAAGVLARLRHDGITDIALLTGDRLAVARAVAAELQIPEFHAELLPGEKADFIAAWKRQHAGKNSERGHGLTRFLSSRKAARIGMVGDGINDAPALASADVGLAIGTGTEVAAEAGDVVFMGDPLRHLPLLIRLSRQTVRIIQQNILVFAFGVNAVGILLTAWLWPWLTPVEWHSQAPVAAVIYHQLGSIAVLLNAMRLLWFERSTGGVTLRKARHRFEAIDRWMEHHVNLDESLHWLSHHWKAATAATAVLIAGAYAASGLTRINPDEVGVVCRFGRPMPEDLQPGLYWRWPWPIERVVRARPDAVEIVEIGFRSRPASEAASTGLGWASAHDALVPEPEEALMMTGDGNLVEVHATVRYTIGRLRTYLFDVQSPADIVRATAESVLRQTIAGRPFLDLLTSARAELQAEVQKRLTERCAEVGGDGLGIRIEGLSVHDLHPPKDVVPAYHDVIKAMQDRDRQINEADAEAKRTLGRAEARSRQTVAAAQASASIEVLQATAERDRFFAWYDARHDLSASQQWQLGGEIWSDLGHGKSLSEAYAAARDRYRQRVAAQTVLTEFRLFWETLAGALKDRDTIIIDADKVPGRRHLFLLDLSQFRLPVPALMSRDPRGSGE